MSIVRFQHSILSTWTENMFCRCTYSTYNIRRWTLVHFECICPLEVKFECRQSTYHHIFDLAGTSQMSYDKYFQFDESTKNWFVYAQLSPVYTVPCWINNQHSFFISNRNTFLNFVVKFGFGSISSWSHKESWLR